MKAAAVGVKEKAAKSSPLTKEPTTQDGLARLFVRVNRRPRIIRL